MKPATHNSDPEITAQTDLDVLLAVKAEEEAARLKRIAGLRLLWERRRLLIRVAAWAFAVAALIAFVIPSRYESTAQLMPPDSQSSSNLAMVAALTARAGSLSSYAGDLLGIKSSGALFIGVLRSQTVQDRLIQDFDLKNVYGEKLNEDARKKLSENSVIAEDRKSGIITITVTDRNPERATDMANAYVRELNSLVTELTTSSAHRERVFLEQRLQVVKNDLDKSAVEFSQFASKNATVDIKEQARAMVEAAATLQGHLIAAQSELEGLRQIYTDNNVRVKSVQARIAELQRRIRQVAGSGTASTTGEKQSGMEYPSIRQLPVLGVKWADLYRQTKIQETIFELLTQQYELAKVQEAKETPTVKVLDAGTVPERKSFPPRVLIMLSSTLLAFVFSAVWVLGQARWDQIDSGDARKQLASEVFGAARTQWVKLSGNGRGWMSALRRFRTPEESPKEDEDKDARAGS